MARYRKLEQRVWNDDKFRNLTPPQPSGGFLWIWLITGPRTSIIPGVVTGRESELAGALDWSLEAFRDSMRDILRQGMAEADWKAGLVWLPNGAKYNPPTAPNVVIHWESEWENLPECPLKDKIYSHLKSFLDGLGKGFPAAFKKITGKHSPILSRIPSEIPSGIASPIQEQEQEQESGAENREQEIRTSSQKTLSSDPIAQPAGPLNESREAEPAKASKRKAKSYSAAFTTWFAAYPRRVAKDAAARAYESAVRRIGIERQILPAEAADWLLQVTGVYAASEAGNNGEFTPHPATWLNAGRYNDDQRDWHRTAQPATPAERRRAEDRRDQDYVAPQ